MPVERAMRNFREVMLPHEATSRANILAVAEHHLGGAVRALVEHGATGEILERASQKTVSLASEYFNKGINGKRMPPERLFRTVILEIERSGVSNLQKSRAETIIRHALSEIHRSARAEFVLQKRLNEGK